VLIVGAVVNSHCALLFFGFGFGFSSGSVSAVGVALLRGFLS